MTSGSDVTSMRPARSRSVDLPGKLAGLLACGERELVRKIVLAQRDLDLHAGIGVAAEDFDDARDRLALRRRLLDDLDDDDVARFRAAALVLRE